MKYVKGNVEWSLEGAPRLTIRTWVQHPSQQLKDLQTSRAATLPSIDTDKMVLDSDVRGFQPHRSRGAVVARTHELNLSEIVRGGVITLHPEVYDEYVEAGYITPEGEEILAGAEVQAPVEPVAEAIEEGAITEEEVVEAPIEEVVSEDNPLDVDGDGDVDAEDVAIVALEAAEQASEKESNTEEDISVDEEEDKPSTEGDGSSEPS